MNPCDWFSTPDIKVKTDTHVRGSCNCCRDNRYESECGCCCFPFFRRRRSVERDAQIQEIYDEVMKNHNSVKPENKTNSSLSSKSVSVGHVKKKKKKHSVKPDKT